MSDTLFKLAGNFYYPICGVYTITNKITGTENGNYKYINEIRERLK